MHMAGLQTALGSDSPGLTLFLIVVGLAVALVLLFWIFRKIAGTGKMGSSRHKQPRLAVSSATPLDGKRRLVLIRRDDVEHLVMIGGSSDVLIENNIVSKRERTGGVRNKRQEPPVEKAEQPEYFPEEERASSGAATIAAASIPATIHQNQDFAPAHVEAAEAPAGIDDEEDMHSLPDPGDSLAAGEPVDNDDNRHGNRSMRKSEYLNYARDSFASEKEDTYSESGLSAAESSELEAELENALLPDDAADDDFSSLDDELEALKPQPAPEVDAPGDDAKAKEASSKSAKEKDPPMEPAEKAKKSPLSRNKDVEDEMQRLLDELANS
jgi:hypothetical protein